MRGTALYIRQASRARVANNTFERNGPVLSFFEGLYSPYVRFLSYRAMTFFSEGNQCINEFDFIMNCNSIGEFILWPQTRGAVYIGHCEDLDCFNNSKLENETNIMESVIEDNIFDSN